MMTAHLPAPLMVSLSMLLLLPSWLPGAFLLLTEAGQP